MIVQLCNTLNSKFTTVICPFTNELNKANELNKKVRVRPLGFSSKQIKGWRLIFTFIVIICRLGRILKREKPDVVHIHCYFAHYIITAIAVKLYAPNSVVVKTIHTSGLFYGNDTIGNKMRVKVEQIATKINRTYIAAISQQVFEQATVLFRRCAIDIQLIHNGVDVSKFYKINSKSLRSQIVEDGRLLVVYVARMVQGKNHLFLVDMWNLLKNKYNIEASLVFVGDGEMRNEIELKINELGLEKDIIRLGNTTNVAQILSICDVALFPSDYEGFGLVMIEKMAASLPVIGSDIAPFREIITHKENGYIVSLSDIEGWCDQCYKLISDSSLRLKIGNAARLRSEDFTDILMAQKYEELYDKIYI